jgi:hypothetical protein
LFHARTTLQKTTTGQTPEPHIYSAMWTGSFMIHAPKPTQGRDSEYCYASGLGPGLIRVQMTLSQLERIISLVERKTSVLTNTAHEGFVMPASSSEDALAVTKR